MAFNPNELVIDRVRSLTARSLDTDELVFRLTQLEDPSLTTAAEGEDVTDAIGSVITTIYRAKTATFSATNSLLSLDLAASQFGSKKQVAGSDAKIVDYTYEIVEFGAEDAEAGKKLAHKPADATAVKYVYEMVKNDVGKSFKAGSAPSATDFQLQEDGTLKPPTGFTGKLFIEYTYESEKAVKVVNKASDFPTAFSAVLYVYFRDVCTDKLISGQVIIPKAKINPESIELGLTATGKHPFEMKINKDYCAGEGEDELFSIVVSE